MLETLTIIDPQPIWIRSPSDIDKKVPALKIDQEWIDGTLKPIALRSDIEVIFNA